MARGEEPSPEPIRIEIEAPSDCADKGSFFDAVRARTALVRRPNENEIARTFVVRVVVGAKGASGTLTIDGTKRTVKGASCNEVVSALAFVAALSIDPDASVTPVTTPSVSSTPAPSASAMESASVASSPSSPPPPPTVVVDDFVPDAPRPVKSTLRFSAGFGVAVAALSAPDVVVLPQAHAEIEDDVVDPLHFDLRVRGARGSSGRVVVDVGAARFRWTTGAIDGCPLHLRLAATFFFRPCLAIEAGAVSASGEAIATPRTHDRLWLSTELVARFDLVVHDALRLELDAGLAAPLLRDSFVFDPSTEIYRPPAIYPFFSLALGVRFP